MINSSHKSTTERRNLRLRHEVCHELDSGCSLKEAIRRVLNRPLPKGFYVEVDTAYVNDRRIRTGESPCSDKLSALKWHDISTQANRFQRAMPSLTRLDAVAKVIATGESRGFYMSKHQALSILKSFFKFVIK